LADDDEISRIVTH